MKALSKLSKDLQKLADERLNPEWAGVPYKVQERAAFLSTKHQLDQAISETKKELEKLADEIFKKSAECGMRGQYEMATGYGESHAMLFEWMEEE